MKWIHVALKWTSLWLRMGKLLHAGMALGKEGIFKCGIKMVLFMAENG
jgi:hypothetical protein